MDKELYELRSKLFIQSPVALQQGSHVETCRIPFAGRAIRPCNSMLGPEQGSLKGSLRPSSPSWL